MTATEQTRVRSPYWHGMLCAETRDEVADRMREVLGDHYFTVVMGNSYTEDSTRFSAIDVYPSQWLTTPVKAHEDSEFAHITWGTPRHAMGVMTSAATRTEGREGGVHKYVHFNFEPDRIVIDHFAPAGYRLQWIFAVERHDREDA